MGACEVPVVLPAGRSLWGGCSPRPRGLEGRPPSSVVWGTGWGRTGGRASLELQISPCGRDEGCFQKLTPARSFC